ncbi:amino acid permease domain-containing protein [Phthorimaea operculella]|nr:amino acid permease domain-containing protein [Phthorimaea operculella]
MQHLALLSPEWWDKVAATALAFKYVGWNWARWVVSCGAVAGIFGSLFGALFPTTRLLYAMANDGMMLHCFGYVSKTKKTPLFAIVVTTCIVAVLASTMELEDLILMMAVGTLSSYTIVAICVIILRYQCHITVPRKTSYFKQILGLGSKEASPMSEKVANITLLLFLIMCIVTAAVTIKATHAIIAIAILNVVILLLLLVMWLQPQAQDHLKFKTPLVPLIPGLSIYMNIHLMLLVDLKTWIRVAVWLAIGIPIYLICLCCYKRSANSFVGKRSIDLSKENGSVQIVVQSPTPPVTPKDTKTEKHTAVFNLDEIQLDNDVFEPPVTPKEDEIIVQHAVVENNEEKEAKIIDLLDQVLQAEEDSYLEKISLKEETPEQEIMIPIETTESIPHRKSFSNLSDAGSETSLGIQDTKYNVIAQVHREDLSKVSEEEEKSDHDPEIPNVEAVNDTTNETTNDNVSTKDPSIYEDAIATNEPSNDDNVPTKESKDEYEQLTSFNDSETNSRTDESGYSDTLDRNMLNDSVEEMHAKDETPRIPTPPPMDESYFNSPYVFQKAHTIALAKPSRPLSRQVSAETNEDDKKPRESVQSNTSQSTEDGNIVFGSSRQMNFMNKLNNIFQHKMANNNEDDNDDSSPEADEQRKRSNSAGDVHNSEARSSLIRPLIFFELKKELEAASVPNLRPVRRISSEKLNKSEPVMTNKDDDDSDEDISMSRDVLKSRLENIFATGGPKMIKPRLMKSNPPTPEENQTDTSSTESTPKLPKMEKNDTLKRQKDKFGAVLNSFRLSYNKDDAV